MIGQNIVIQQLQRCNAKSILLTGPAHWGKKTLLRELFQNDESVYEISGNAAAFRESIERVYSTMRETTYIIPDVHNCNATVQNLLLKVLEEPPKAARFYLTASGPILPTITSRCVSYRMQPYSEGDLGRLRSKPELIGLFQSPGQLALLNLEGVENLIQILKQIKASLDEGHTLAFVLKLAKNIHRSITDIGITHEAYIILLQAIFGDTPALTWLRAQPKDALRYLRAEYFMRVWLERQVG